MNNATETKLYQIIINYLYMIYAICFIVKFYSFFSNISFMNLKNTVETCHILFFIYIYIYKRLK